MIRTPDELKAQAKLKNITFYPVHDCSMCGYQCGYRFDYDEPVYDSGCYCTGRETLDQRSWDDLAYCYNMNQPENNPNIKAKFLFKLNDTWQFDDAVIDLELDKPLAKLSAANPPKGAAAKYQPDPEN